MKPNQFKAAQLLCASVVGFALSLPFVAVGGTIRSAYGLVQSANNLDMVKGPVRLLLAVTIVSAPMMIGGLLLTVGLGWNRAFNALAILISLLGIGSGIASLLVSSSKPIGPMVTLGGGSILFLATIVAMVHQKRLRKRAGAENGIRKLVTMGGSISE